MQFIIYLLYTSALSKLAYNGGRGVWNQLYSAIILRLKRSRRVGGQFHSDYTI